MVKTMLTCWILWLLVGCTVAPGSPSDVATTQATSGNPLWDGWYADPEVCVIGDRYWIFPTYSGNSETTLVDDSRRYDHQQFLDAFSSPDLVTWTKHERVLTSDSIEWAYHALWAPCVAEKDGKVYLFFGANDLQRPGGPFYDPDDPKSSTGGIGVAVADSPEGPYVDLLGEPLIGDFHHDAQPIDQFVFQDTDGTWYIYYGGWGQCNVGVLADDFRSIVPGDDGELFQNITPEGYVEGPVLFIRDGKYYFMWSEGGWGDDSYRVAYAIADSPTGPFERIDTILQTDRNVDIATGAGHNSVLNVPGSDDWYIVYHRRPIPNEGRDHRVTCIDKLEFNEDGTIKPVVMTFTGVGPNPVERP